MSSEAELVPFRFIGSSEGTVYSNDPRVIEVEGLVVSNHRIESGAEFVISLSEPFLEFGEMTVRVPGGLASFVITRFRQGAKVMAEGEYHVFTDEAGDDSLVLEASTVGIIAERYLEL